MSFIKLSVFLLIIAQHDSSCAPAPSISTNEGPTSKGQSALVSANEPRLEIEIFEMDIATAAVSSKRSTGSKFDGQRELPAVPAETLARHGIDVGQIEKTLKPLLETGQVVPANVTEFPYSAYVKVIAFDNAGNEFHCSGTYVSNKLVLTAAHCAVDDSSRQPYETVTCIQRYENGKGVTKRVHRVFFYKSWHADGRKNYAYDYAFLTMLDETSGGFVELDVPDDYKNITVAGYPRNYGNGEVLHMVYGSKGDQSTQVVQHLNNPMGPGCSGGAWIVKRSAHEKAAIGLNSFHYVGAESVMYSPRFTHNETMRLFATALQSLTGGLNATLY